VIQRADKPFERKNIGVLLFCENPYVLKCKIHDNKRDDEAAIEVRINFMERDEYNLKQIKRFIDTRANAVRLTELHYTVFDDVKTVLNELYEAYVGEEVTSDNQKTI
jgi:hypothetical protein